MSTWSVWSLFARVPLRRMLTVPYVVLVLGLAAVLLGLSLRAGQETVAALSGQLAHEASMRSTEALERQLGSAEVMLEAAFPRGLPAPANLDGELDAVRLRLWQATGIAPEPNAYVYYGDAQGRFVGLLRVSATEGELRLRRRGNEPARSRSHFQGPTGALRALVPEDKPYEPRDRPWYLAAQAADPAWSPVYIDFRTGGLVTTRTRRVADAQGTFAGVAAADVTLAQLSSFLRGLSLSPHAVALVIEANGDLIASSRGNHLRTLPSGEPGRLNAEHSDEPLVRDAYLALRRQVNDPTTSPTSHGLSFHDSQGEVVQLGYARLGERTGLNWWVLVAVPRSDYLAEVRDNLLRSSLVAGCAVLLAVGIGLLVLMVVTRELRQLGAAARRVGEGALDVPPDIHRDDELGDLARSFADMQQRLLTDQLTGLSNRTALLRRVDERVQQHRRRGDTTPFAVMFADFNKFKAINDRFGHAVGDAVLKEMAQRLRQGVRLGDMVARFAGDEFVVMLDTVAKRSDAEAARAHLEAALRAPLQALADCDPTANQGASIGMAVFPDDGDDAEQLLQAADEDMYARKRHAPDTTRPAL